MAPCPFRGGSRRALPARLRAAASLACSVPDLRASHLAARRLSPRPSRTRRAAQMRRPGRVLVRLRLFPRRTLLGRRGLSRRALAAWLAHPLRHDRSARWHGIVLRGGRGACHADVVARSRKSLRPRHRLRIRRVRARPCLDRASLEPRGLLHPRRRRDDANRLAVRRLCLEPTRRALVRKPGRDRSARGLAARRWQRHDRSRGLTPPSTQRRRFVGRTKTRSRRQRWHRHQGAHRPGRHRSGREMAAREQRRDFHRLSQSHQVRRARAHRHRPRGLARDGGAVSSRRFSRGAVAHRRGAARRDLALRRLRAPRRGARCARRADCHPYL